MKHQSKVNGRKRPFTAIDLFCGCGGLSQGVKQAGFDVILAVDNSKEAIASYKLNHPEVATLQRDVRSLLASDFKKVLANRDLDILAGCPPCQGFSSVRRLNKDRSVRDSRNILLLEFLRIVKITKPKAVMLENVPGLERYFLFKKFVKGLAKAGYHVDYSVVNVAHYGVPQRRRRFILVGSRLGPIKVKQPNGITRTVWDAIGSLEPPKTTSDPLHRIVPKHTDKVRDIIKLVPKNGGSWREIPKRYWLECHTKKNVGFNDIYGRLRWDTVSSTITGGCLNPSKGRFLHPTKNRVITPREAALLQSFPRHYRFPTDIPRGILASLIGNALPPRFSRIQSANIAKHLKAYNG
jgi:DNA (cytosine-5)-methyltransferase 1